MTESGIIKVLKLARTAHFQNLSKTALQFILQHTVNLLLVLCNFIATITITNSRTKKQKRLFDEITETLR
jgi:hypothetical protein